MEQTKALTKEKNLKTHVQRAYHYLRLAIASKQPQEIARNLQHATMLSLGVLAKLADDYDQRATVEEEKVIDVGKSANK